MSKQPYDRLTDESTKAYAAFVTYRDMGIQRSIGAAWKQQSKSTKSVPGYFSAWSSEHNWVERAAAYDDYIDAQARKQLERDAIKQKVDMLKRHALTGKVMQQKAVQYLDMHGIDKAADAINAAAKGIDIERKAVGLPEWIFEVVNADDNELARQYAELYAQVSGTGSGDAAQGDGDTQAGTAAPDTSA